MGAYPAGSWYAWAGAGGKWQSITLPRQLLFFTSRASILEFATYSLMSSGTILKVTVSPSIFWGEIRRQNQEVNPPKVLFSVSRPTKNKNANGLLCSPCAALSLSLSLAT